MHKQVIEFGGEPVGVVVPDAGGLKFVAVKYHVWELDSRRFRSVEEATAAVRQLLTAHDPALPLLRASNISGAPAAA